MVGTTLALALAGAGIETVLLDRAPLQRQRDPTFDGRASAIAWGSAQALAGIGAWDGAAESGIERHAEPIREIRVSDGPSLLFLHYRHDEVADHPLGYMVENRDIRAVLASRLEA